MIVVTKIWRTLRIPDEVLMKRCQTTPSLGPKILFFSGGSAINKICRSLKRYTHNSIHLVTPFDSGGSSAILRDEFHMPAVGDLRSRLMALADESVLGQPSIYELFQYRFSKHHDNALLREELATLVQGTHPLIHAITNPMRQLICTQLKVTQQEISDKFNLQGASIGNLIIAGGYLNNQKQLDPIVFLFSRLVKVLGDVQTIADVSYHLGAELDDGTHIIGQHRITGKECDVLTSPIKRIFLTQDLEQGAPIDCQLPDDRKELILGADIICYPPGSFYSSLLVNLLLPGVGEAILNNTNPKVYLPNLGVDPEQLGLTLVNQVEKIIDVVSRGKQVNATNIIDFIVLEMAVFNDLSSFEKQRMEEMGITLLPLPLMDNDHRYYKEELVAQMLISIS